MKYSIATVSVRLFLAAALSAAGPCMAVAQDYPSKPAKFVNPYQAGGGLDMMCRLVADQLTARFNSPFIVENRPGGSGTIGAAAVASAPPDGYTLMCGNSSEITLAPFVVDKLPYDPRDLSPITMAVRQTVVLVAHPSVAAADAKQLFALTRKRPLTYASPGAATNVQLAMEMFSAEAQAPFVHVPYKGAAGLVTDVLAGHVDLVPGIRVE